MSRPGEELLDVYPLSELTKRVSERIGVGEQSYPPGEFLRRSVLEEAEEEVLDLITYLYFAWVKLQDTKARLHTLGIDIGEKT